MNSPTPAAPPSLVAALAGLRVLDFSRLLPGPYLSMVLGDLGADVVKIEDTGAGDYLRTMPPLVGGVSARYQVLNRNKRSVALDLKQPAGKAACLELVREADIVIESFRPGVMARLGLDHEALRVANPRLIYCSITGYGQTGPYRERAGHDLNYVALAGMLGNCQAGPQAPVPGAQIGDLAGGALWPLAGILAALLVRHQTGLGQYLDMSMTEGALALMAAEFSHDARGDTWLTGGAATYQVYETADGGAMAVAPLEPKFVTAMTAALRSVDPAFELARDAETAKAQLAAIFRQQPRAYWETLFAAHDACIEPVLALGEVLAHPQHVARGVASTHQLANGATVTYVKTPLAPARADRPAPSQGQHNADFGLTSTDQAAASPAKSK